MISKILLFLFCILALVIYGCAAQVYNGQWYIYLLFTIVFNFYLIYSFRTKKIFFENFLSVFLWLGFWLKFSVRIAFKESKFLDPVGFFDFSPGAFDLALLVSSVGAIGLIISSFVREKFFSYLNHTEISNLPLENFYKKYKNYLWVLFVIFSVAIAVANFKLGLYQRGRVPGTVLPFGLSNIVTWLLLFGLTSISAVMLNYEFKNKDKKLIYILFAFLEIFLSNISMISRAFVLNMSAIIYGSYEALKLSNQKVSFKKIILGLFILVIFFGSSILITNFNRLTSFESASDIKAIQESSVTTKINMTVRSTVVLFIDRWVGIEPVMAVSSYPFKGWDLWSKAWSENFLNQGTSFYDLNLIKSPYLKDDLTAHHFITLPGVIAFFFYPGSFAFLLFSMMALGLLGALMEYAVYTFSSRNIVLCSLMAQVVAYRFIHFGYVPKQSYLLFSSVLLNALLFFAANWLLEKRR